jgi:putative phosphoesterase
VNKQRIGVIADTHGLLRPEALKVLKGSNLIIHAGDIGKPQVLEALQEVAPVVAVRGNADKGSWAQALPQSEAIEVAQTWLYVIHDLSELDLEPSAAGFRGVVCGHSHRPSVEIRKGVIFLNPGSAGPRRFNLPISVAVIDVKDRVLQPHLVELEVET